LKQGFAATGAGDGLIETLRDVLGDGRLLTEAADRIAYGCDNSTRQGMPLAVALPDTHAEVVAIVAACHRHRLPVIARGQGTGTTGAAVPLGDALILCLNRMNRIVQIDPDNRLLIAEPGVTNQAIQAAAGAAGFFWPPDPTSASVCTLGGNLACNAAGPRAVKYGTPRENTLGLRAVSGTGRAFRTGVKTTKGVVGYDLTRLLIGSEGTLAVITQATLKLTPLPEAKVTLQAVYRDMAGAAHAVSRIMAQPVVPCALEFMDAAAIDMVRAYADCELPRNAGALLMIEVDGTQAELERAAAAIRRAAENDALLNFTQAATREDVEALWRTRKALSPALREVAPKKINEDVVVPVSRIPELVTRLEALAARYAIPIVNFGHAGNGNLHVNLLFDPDDAGQQARAEQCLDEVFTTVLALDGTLSGEHGIGWVKREFVARELDPEALALMHAIKAQFDPAGILNPGKTLPAVGGRLD